MSTNDIIKKSILESFNSDITNTTIIISMVITILIALYIYAIYRLCSNKNFYSKDLIEIIKDCFKQFGKMYLKIEETDILPDEYYTV